MGAEENAETESKAVEPSSEFSSAVEEKLSNGWSLSETSDGQLLLVPPPARGEPTRP